MWDEYLSGDCERISPEAPVPVVKIIKEKQIPGGAGNVVRNLTALGIHSGIAGVVGNDPNGLSIQNELKKWDLELMQIWKENGRPTTVKTRVIARNQQIIRLDREKAVPIHENLEKEVLEALSHAIPKFDAVILSDYDKGFLTENLTQRAIQIAQEKGVYVAADPKSKNFALYHKADLLTPNEKEAANAVQMPIPASEEEVEKIADLIKKQIKVKNLLITRSHKGMSLFGEADKPVYIPTTAREVYDVTGAGDTVISVYVASIIAGGSPFQAAALANLAGGLVVGKFGVSTISREELERALRSNNEKN